MTTQIWRQSGKSFRSGSTAQDHLALPPGIYEPEITMFGWELKQIQEKFEFPFKIYGNNSDKINRIITYWENTNNSLGLILNGLKGTGKTITAQILANTMVDRGIPVLIVKEPLNILDQVLMKLHQPVMILFDEFEKTHHQKETQQKLLSTVDGLSRSNNRRLFVFTMNNKTVDSNFIDRPSRIRYTWEFDRLDDEIIEEIMDDLLLPDLSCFRGDIVSYINSRSVISIDVVKTVIQEVNIFKESPSVFNKILNLSEITPTGFRIEILDSNKEVVHTYTENLHLNTKDTKTLAGCLSKSGSLDVKDRIHNGFQYKFYSKHTNHCVQLVNATDDPSIWIAHLSIPISDSWLAKYPKVAKDLQTSYLMIDEKPEGWKPPEWAKAWEAGEDLDHFEDEIDTYESNCRLYVSSATPKEFLIKITPNFVQAKPTFSWIV